MRSYEVDPLYRLTPRALCAYLQEVAGVHATLLGASMETLAAAGLAWVLHRLKVVVAQQARRGDLLEVTTWPTRFDRVVAHRDFVIRRAEGELIAEATSQWAVADLKTRRPVRMPEFILAIAGEEAPPTVELGRGELPVVTHPSLTRTFPVRRADLDVVRHVTNTQYVAWVTETVPEELEETHRLAALEIVFHREARYGDTVVAETERLDEADPAFAHVLRDTADGRELVRAVTAWTGP